MYNDFLGELIAEETRTGKRRKRANPLNRYTLERRKMQEAINTQAGELGLKPEEIALDIVKNNLPLVQRFVTEHGETPMRNPIDLCAQAAIIRQKDIDKIAKSLNVSPIEAEMMLEESEANAAEINSSESDNFLGAIAQAVGNVANRVFTKIKEKREAKGKKAGFWGMLSDVTAPQTKLSEQAVQQYQNAEGADFGEKLKIAASDVLRQIKDQERKKEINKMLPLIIIAALGLIIITALIARRK